MDLLAKANMAMSLSLALALALMHVMSLTYVTIYGSIVGGLQHLLLKRHGIVFVVNKLSEFMHHLTMTH